MFHSKTQIAPARVSHMLKAAEAAARAIPPAFPLDATVAVNPFLGQTTEDLATAGARLERVAGVRLTLPRENLAARIARGEVTDDDLANALLASTSPLKPADLGALKGWTGRAAPAPRPLPTLADLASGSSGADWPDIIARAFGLWAAGYFDRGQALWTPAPGQTAFVAWRAWASHDLTPEIAGLTGFCGHVAASPDTPERAILRAADTLKLTEASAESVFHRLLTDLGGWAQHARWLLWQAELAGGTDSTLTELLAIRLIWEEALYNAHEATVASTWDVSVLAHSQPPAPDTDQVVDAILQEAAERAHQRRLAGLLAAAPVLPGTPARPAMQAAFCIDVRSEVFRRALEAQDDAIATIGFAGFFGLTVAHRPFASDLVQAHLPVLLTPGVSSVADASEADEAAARIAARSLRAWGRFRQAAVSSFAFVEAAGPLYAGKLLRGALGLDRAETDEPAPRLDPSMPAEAKAATAAAVLNAMSMTTAHARLVLLLGHGAQVTNNPHASAYHCGACGGQTGEVSARLLAQLLNDPEARAGLAAHGLSLPEDTLFVAGLHDTTTDVITLWSDSPDATHSADLAQARAWMATAGHAARTERALRLPGATAETVASRAHDWAQLRPEWGLAGCAAFVAAPRPVTRGRNLAGRAFLHCYDWQADKGFGTLELILTAPVVVASWISLQYYGSVVAPEVFGGGNKLLHNVTGGIGVIEGNGGRLRAGLPWQAVHDGSGLAHDPLRLTVMIEAPVAAMQDILDRHPQVRALFDNGWLHLMALEGGQPVARYRPGGTWVNEAPARAAA